MSSALIFIAVLGLLVVIHEFGHFIVARWCGVRVEKFSIGFGPVIFGRQYGETEFCVSLLPFGGFVKMAGENPGEATGQAWEFNSKSAMQKLWIVAAGPLMNAFLAFVIFAGIFMVGQPTLTNIAGKIMADSPAQRAGIQEKDKIVSVDGVSVALWTDILEKIRANKGEAMTLTVQRESGPATIVVQPDKKEIKDIFGKTHTISFLGVSPSNEMVQIRHNFFESIYLGAERVVAMTAMIFYSLWMMITGAMPFKESIAGPIGIFVMTKDAAQLGILYLFYFTGSLSVSLFVLNLLPIPVLDGGHLLFLLIEKIKGSPLRESIKDKMTQVGLVTLLAFMGFVIIQDVSRFGIFDGLKTLLGGR